MRPSSSRNRAAASSSVKSIIIRDEVGSLTSGSESRDRPDAGHDLAFRKMAVAHDALLARLGLEIGVLCEKLSNLRFDRLGQQRTRAAAQDLCEGIGKGPWLGEL